MVWLDQTYTNDIISRMWSDGQIYPRCRTSRLIVVLACCGWRVSVYGGGHWQFMARFTATRLLLQRSQDYVWGYALSTCVCCRPANKPQYAIRIDSNWAETPVALKVREHIVYTGEIHEFRFTLVTFLDYVIFILDGSVAHQTWIPFSIIEQIFYCTCLI